MIPSDHFPRFYNEVFKFIEQQGEKELEDYFLRISRNQENHLLHLIEEKGFAGMQQYWSVIRDEENCDLDLGYDADKFEIHMHQCPSLPKAQDSDAGAWERYCDHCAGWIGPIMDKTGYHLVYDVIDRDLPQCHMRVFKDEEKAREAEMDVKLLMGWPGHKKD